MTIEEYAALPDDDFWRDELVRGVRVREPRPGGEHARLQARLARHLDAFAEARDLGTVLADAGFVLAEDPATVRGPDVAFVARARLPGGVGTGYLRVAPDLAVEILSPSNRTSAVQAKVNEYLAAGVRLVWVVDPRTRTITSWRTAAGCRVLGVGDELDGEDVLPGFRLPLTALWSDRSRGSGQ
jgi:Uma2 family endonuclease